MSKFWIVFRQEYAQVVKKKSFVVGLLLTPILMGAFIVLPALLAQMKSSSTERLAVIDQSGYGLGRSFAESLDQYKLDDDITPYYQTVRVYDIRPSDSAGFAAVSDTLRGEINDKSIKYFLVLRKDAQLHNDSLYMVTNADNITSLKRFERRLTELVSAIRLRESNVNLGVDSVLTLTKSVDLEIRDTKGESISFITKYFSAMIFVGIMFGMMMGYGQLVMRSVIEEKNSRVMEVLISSVTPFQLMLGKVLGLGAATLTQVAIWFAVGAMAFVFRGTLNIDPSVDRIVFNPAVIVFFVLFLISGYLLFSTLFALIGSIVNTEKEAQNFVAPLTILMVLPFMLGIVVIQDPNGLLATVVSFIPFTAPAMMVMRLVFVAPMLESYSIFSGIVAEATISLALVTLTTMIMIWVTGKIFRVGILMYGKRPTLPEIMKWIKY